MLNARQTRCASSHVRSSLKATCTVTSPSILAWFNNKVNNKVNQIQLPVHALWLPLQKEYSVTSKFYYPKQKSDWHYVT